MIDKASTLHDVCFAVARTLETHGISAVLTGGSAAAIYAPQSYISHDADFVLEGDVTLDRLSSALATIGFQRAGKSRIFAHPVCPFTVDFPKGPLAVGGDYVRETAVLQDGDMRLRILTRTDCVRDRLAHYYYWDDYTALNAAVAVTIESNSDVDMEALREWTARESGALLTKFTEYIRRLRL